MDTPTDPLRNRKDPLRDSGPSNERDLFRAMGAVANGAPLDALMGAAMNVVINAIRQSCSTRNGAERMFDEAAMRAKHALLELHYDGAGRRRNVFPYRQEVGVPHMNLRGKINGH